MERDPILEACQSRSDKTVTAGRVDAIKFQDGAFEGFAQCSLCFYHFHSRRCPTEQEALERGRAGLADHERKRHPQLNPAKEGERCKAE